MKKILVFSLFLVGIFGSKGQNLNDYKYVVVPEQFNFLKEADQYQVNSLTKFLFNKYGFDAYLAKEELPLDLNSAGCNTLYADVESSGFLSTNMIVTLADCRGNVVYTSPEGKSKIKEYKAAYHDALREAFLGIEELDYSYNGKTAAMAEKKEMKRVPPAEEKEVKDTPPVPASETIVVDTYQEVQTPTEIVEKENKASSGVNKVRTAKPTVNQPEALKGTYTSTDGSYSVKESGSGVDIYEGGQKIGSARKTSAGSYLINTSQFTGIGYFDGEQFVIEREIKGVQGLVKMLFTKSN